MSFRDQLAGAFSAQVKKFSVGEKVLLRGEDRPFVVESINHVSYDLVMDISEDEIAHLREIVAKSVRLKELSFEHWVEVIAKDTPYSHEEIAEAQQVLASLRKSNVEEDEMKKVE